MYNLFLLSYALFILLIYLELTLPKGVTQECIILNLVHLFYGLSIFIGIQNYLKYTSDNTN